MQDQEQPVSDFQRKTAAFFGRPTQDPERPISDREQWLSEFFGHNERDQQNPWRRIWNWPLRIGLSVWLVTALLSLWVSGPVIEDLFTVGFAALCVWTAGFLWTMARDLRYKKR